MTAHLGLILEIMGAHSEKTDLAPEKWWLGDKPFLLKRPIFRGYVGFRVGIANISIR